MKGTNDESDATTAPPTTQQMQQTIQKYTQVMDAQMKPMLHKSLRRKEHTLVKLGELDQTQLSLRALQLSLEQTEKDKHHSHLEQGERVPVLQARVNLGEQFYMQAHVYHADTVIASIGSNMLVEMTVPEAERFFAKKRSLLQQRLQQCQILISDLEAQLLKMAHTISQLTRTNQ